MTVIQAQVRSVVMQGDYSFKATLPSGRVFQGSTKNFVPTVGRAAFVNAYFGLGTFPALNMSLVNSAQGNFASGQYEAGDDFQGSLKWAEFTGYAAAVRKAVTWSADAVGSKIETDFETFSMVSTTDRLSGVFLATGTAKTGALSPTSGDELFSVAPWSAPAAFGFKRGLIVFLDEFTVKYRMRLFHSGPSFDGGDSFAAGGATTAALNDMLNVAFRGATVTSTWFVGFISATGFGTIRETDTLASHPGWVEVTGTFNEGDRLPVTFSTTSTNGLIFSDVATVTALVPGKILGMFLTDQESGTSGLLHSAIQFTGTYTPGVDFRKYDRLEMQYGVGMDDVGYSA